MDLWTPASLYTKSGARKYLTPPERERFIAAANACPRLDLATLGLTLAHTGCRISEALNLTPNSLYPRLGFIAVTSLKKRGVLHVREIPAPAALFDALGHYVDCRSAETIWTLSRSQAWRLIKALMALAQIPPGIHATPKGLRHAYGLHAIRSGIPLNLLQRWLGHSRMETTAIYANALGPEEMEIARRMWPVSSEVSSRSL